MKMDINVKQGFLGLNARMEVKFEGTLTEWEKSSKELNINL